MATTTVVGVNVPAEGIIRDLTEQEQQDLAEALAAKPQISEYAINRKTEYPSIGDQLDALFHAGVFPTEMQQKIQAVKDKYPKDAE